MIFKTLLLMLRGHSRWSPCAVEKSGGSGVYPAIDLEASISRSMLQIVDKLRWKTLDW